MLSFYLTGFKKLFGIGKKIFIVIAVYFTVISLFLYFMNKDKPKITYDPIIENRKEIFKVINDQNLNKTKEGKLTVSVFRAMTCGFLGEACTDNPSDGDKNYSKSILGFTSNLITLPYINPPASGLAWVYSGLQNSGFVAKSYAAEGIGLAAIKPFANIWKIFRDVSYMILVLIMISIGFMIMFRMKLNPQTVISVESALPKIVVTLLLITLSFPIAGFLIDLMYILIVISISILAPLDPNNTAMQLQNLYLTGSFGTIWDSMFVNESIWSKIPLIGGFATLFQVGDALVGILPGWINDLIRGIAVFIIGDFVLLRFFSNILPTNQLTVLLDDIDILGNSVGKLPGGILGILLKVILIPLIFLFTIIHGAGWIVGLLVFFTMLLLLFRIFFILFTSYLKMILLVIFSPLFLLIEAIPGKGAFKFWFTNLLSQILVFPMVIILLIVGRIIVNTMTVPGAKIWQPPFLYGIDPKSFSVLIGMGIIFMIPELVKLTRELLGIKELPVGLTLSTFFAGVGTGVGGAAGLAGQYGSLALALPGLRKIAGDRLKDVPLLGSLLREK